MNNSKNIRLAQSAAFLRSCAFYLPIISLFFLQSGASVDILILVQVLYSAVTLLLEIPTGIFSDTFGHKNAVRFGYIFGSLSLLSTLLLSGGIGAAVFYILFAVADSFISGSEQAYVFEQSQGDSGTYKKQYGHLLGLQSLALALSTGISAVVLKLHPTTRYSLLFGATLMAYLSALLLSLFITGKGRSRTAKQTNKSALQQSISAASANHAIKALFVLGVVTVSGEYFLYSVYQPYFVAHGINTSTIAWLLSGGAILNYYIVKNSYRLEKVLRFESIALLSSLVTATLFAAMALWQNAFVLAVAFIMLRGLFNSLSPIVSDYTQAASDPSIHATLLSTMSLTQSIASILLRLALAYGVAKIGISFGLGAYATYLAVGSVFAYWYLKRCGCVGKVPVRSS